MVSAEPGKPELVFDENDPEIAVGIRLNLPDSVRNQIATGYLENSIRGGFKGTQEDFERSLVQAQNDEDFERLANLVLTEDLYIPDVVLVNNFENEFLGFYNNGRISCSFDSDRKYLTCLHNMISLCF